MTEAILPSNSPSDPARTFFETGDALTALAERTAAELKAGVVTEDRFDLTADGTVVRDLEVEVVELDLLVQIVEHAPGDERAAGGSHRARN